MYPTGIVPLSVRHGIRLFFLLLLFYTVSFCVFGFLKYAFSKDYDKKKNATKFIKKGTTTLIIGIIMIGLLILIEQTVPKMAFDISKAAMEYPSQLPKNYQMD